MRAWMTRPEVGQTAVVSFWLWDPHLNDEGVWVRDGGPCQMQLVTGTMWPNGFAPAPDVGEKIKVEMVVAPFYGNDAHWHHNTDVELNEFRDGLKKTFS